MKNKMELLQAAQKSAAESLATTMEIDLVNTKTSAFAALGIAKEHYSDFSAYFDTSRASYLSLAQVPVKPAANE